VDTHNLSFKVQQSLIISLDLRPTLIIYLPHELTFDHGNSTPLLFNLFSSNKICLDFQFNFVLWKYVCLFYSNTHCHENTNTDDKSNGDPDTQSNGDPDTQSNKQQDLQSNG
jgi:hypothetical protein